MLRKRQRSKALLRKYELSEYYSTQGTKLRAPIHIAFMRSLDSNPKLRTRIHKRKTRYISCIHTIAWTILTQPRSLTNLWLIHLRGRDGLCSWKNRVLLRRQCGDRTDLGWDGGQHEQPGRWKGREWDIMERKGIKWKGTLWKGMEGNGMEGKGRREYRQ